MKKNKIITQEDVDLLLEKTDGDFDIGPLWTDADQINFETLSTFPLGIKSILGDGLDFWRLPSHLKNTLIFYNVWSPNLDLGRHLHNCLEVIDIVEGSLIWDDYEYQKGDRIYLPAYRAHVIKAGKKGAIFLVIFSKN